MEKQTQATFRCKNKRSAFLFRSFFRHHRFLLWLNYLDYARLENEVNWLPQIFFMTFSVFARFFLLSRSLALSLRLFLSIDSSGRLAPKPAPHCAVQKHNHWQLANWTQFSMLYLFFSFCCIWKLIYYTYNINSNKNWNTEHWNVLNRSHVVLKRALDYSQIQSKMIYKSIVRTHKYKFAISFILHANEACCTAHSLSQLPFAFLLNRKNSLLVQKRSLFHFRRTCNRIYLLIEWHTPKWIFRLCQRNQ